MSSTRKPWTFMQNHQYPLYNPTESFSITRQHIPKLQKITTYALSVEIWRRKIREHPGTVSYKELFEEDPNIEDYIEIFDVFYPTIKKSVRLIATQTIKWFDYNSRIFFIPLNSKSIENYFSKLVWCPHGTINYEKTAKKLLLCDENEGGPTALEKYYVACTYCLENELQSIWLERYSIYEPAQTTNNILLYYWNCRMMNKFYSIPMLDRYFVEYHIINSSAVSNWPAVRYFLTQLHIDHQLIKAAEIVQHKEPLCIESLIPILNDVQFIHVIEECGPSIVLILANGLHSSKYAFQVWLQIQHSITYNQLIYILLELLNLDDDYDHVSDLMTKIWTSTSYQFKSYMWNNYTNLIIHLLHLKGKRCTKRLRNDLKFFAEFISQTDYQFRNYIWRANWSKLIIGAELESLKKLMKLCFHNDAEIVHFKEKIIAVDVTTKEYCFELICKDRLDELDHFLEFCSENTSLSPGSLKKALLSSRILVENYLFYLNNTRITSALDNFINECCNTVELSNLCKNNIAILPDNLQYLYGQLNHLALNDIKKYVELMISSKRDLSRVKAELAEHCGQSIIKKELSTFHYNRKKEMYILDEFLKWCFNDDQKLSKFKQSLLKDENFRTIFQNYMNGYDEHNHFNIHAPFMMGIQILTRTEKLQRRLLQLQSFLSWCLPDEKAVRDFKLAKITATHGNEYITTYFNRESVRFIDELLEWFFTYDHEQIEKYKRDNLTLEYINRSIFILEDIIGI